MLFGGELEHEIPWKAVSVPFCLLVQLLGADAVEFGEVAVEDDPQVPEDQDARFDRWGDY